MSLPEARDLAAVLGGMVALITFIMGVIEYVRQGAQGRAERFTNMRQRFKDDPSFKKICDLLETNDPQLNKLPVIDKYNFLGFFEEIALMLNSRLIRPSVAHYMFGYYAIQCSESKKFWSDLNRDGPYWALFNDFAARMKLVENRFVFRRRSLRF